MIVRYIFLILNYSGLFRSSLQRCSYKSCSKTKQQIYRRTPVLKCDSNKVALQCWFAILLKLHFSIGFFLVNLLYIFRTSFLRTPVKGYFYLLFLIHFRSVVPMCTPWKHQTITYWNQRRPFCNCSYHI